MPGDIFPRGRRVEGAGGHEKLRAFLISSHKVSVFPRRRQFSRRRWEGGTRAQNLKMSSDINFECPPARNMSKKWLWPCVWRVQSGWWCWKSDFLDCLVETGGGQNKVTRVGNHTGTVWVTFTYKHVKKIVAHGLAHGSRKKGYGVPCADLVGDAGRWIFWVVFCEEGCAEFSNTRNPSYERILSDFHI